MVMYIFRFSYHVVNDMTVGIKMTVVNLPTSAKMTVSRGAAGNVMVVLNSNICKSSTMKTKIWCCEYLNNMVMDTVCKKIDKGERGPRK